MLDEENKVSGDVSLDDVLEEIIESEYEDSDEAEGETIQLQKNWRDGMTEEEIKAMEKLLSKTSFYAHSIALASKAERKRATGKNVITDDGEPMTTADKAKEDRLNIVASAESKKVLKGVIASVKPAGESAASTNLAVIRYGNQTVKVYIPDFLLFDFDLKDIRDPNIQRKHADMITKMINTEISFVVKQYDQKTNTAYADRLKALEIEANRYYMRPLASTNKPRVKVGDIVKGRVTAVNRKSVRVCALGSESLVYQDASKGIFEASWHYAFDLRDIFKVNQIIPLKVLSIKGKEVQKYAEKYRLVETQFSIKQTEENPQVRNFENYRVNQVCSCIVTAVNDSLTHVYGVIDVEGKVDCMISYPKFGDMPKVGDERVVRIIRMATETDKGATVEEDGSPVRRIYCHFADK